MMMDDTRKETLRAKSTNVCETLAMQWKMKGLADTCCYNKRTWSVMVVARGSWSLL
jgi:hypothetical protein